LDAEPICHLATGVPLYKVGTGTRTTLQKWYASPWNWRTTFFVVITGCAVAPAQLLTATGLVYGRWRFLTPYRESISLNRSPKNLSQVITSATLTDVPNLVHIRSWGAYVFGNTPTRRRIFARDGSNDADSRKDVPFWVLLTLLPFRG